MATDKASRPVPPAHEIEKDQQTPSIAPQQDIPWYEAVEKIRPHVVRIATPRGTGTGFVLTNSQTGSLSSIATAAHVVDQAHSWEEPIRIEHVHSSKSLMVRQKDRALFLDPKRDTAAVLFDRKDLPLPSQPLPLIERGKFLRVGNDIGWLGFPAISTELCFFGGRISAWLQSESAYLVDGVTISGVSGGPAFVLVGQLAIVIGVVTAYVPNRATGEALPGLGVVRDVVQFHDLVPRFASLDQAQAEQTPPVINPQSTAPSSSENPTKRVT